MFKVKELTPVRFYPYTSRVKEVIYRTDRTIETALFQRELVQHFLDLGIPAEEDNKTVFEVTTEHDKTLYFGFYDCRFTMGSAVETEARPWEV